MDIKLSKLPKAPKFIWVALGFVVAAVFVLPLITGLFSSSGHQAPGQEAKQEDVRSYQEMMSDFEEHDTCGGCGAGRETMTLVMVLAGKNNPKSYTNGEGKEFKVLENHLRVTCTNCQCGWTERTKHATEERNNNGH